jgi:hypothetical protein
LLKEASNALGVEYFEMFTAMITNRTYEDVMKRENKLKTKQRLGGPKTDEEKRQLQEYTLHYHSDISEILGQVNRKLLLVFKTNNYLRAIDNKLGTPLNTFSNLNESSWDIYQKEILPKGNWR